MDLTSIPLFDHHCHALRRPGMPLDATAFRGHFSESRDPAMAAHQPSALFYRRGLRILAEFLGCDGTEEAVLGARDGPSPEAYARRLLEAANLSEVGVDTGYRGAEHYTLDEQRAFLPCPVYEVMRLETLVEELVPETSSFADLEERYRYTLDGARDRGIIALKSIAAYRGGLRMSPPDRAAAIADYADLRDSADGEEGLQLDQRGLLEYLLRVGIDIAAAQELPIQFHTGFGDDDGDLREANPLHLRPLLQDRALRGAPVVLLHCWPYVREAGYLAALYGHVYVDLSLTIPFTAHGGAAAILAALEQAPTSKVLLSTDAFGIPELFYLGALSARESLASALETLRAGGWLASAEVEPIARQMLFENATDLYLTPV